jgi:hypothetical protein
MAFLYFVSKNQMGLDLGLSRGKGSNPVFSKKDVQSVTYFI